MSKARSNVWKLRNIVDVADPAFGAKCDGVTDDTAAWVAAFAAAKHIFWDGTSLVDTVAIPGSGGYVLEGFSPTTAVLKARTNATTKLLDLHGTTVYAQNNVLKNFSLDMSNMTDVGTSYGLYEAYAYNNHHSKIVVTGNGVNKVSLRQECSGVSKGVYTGTFEACDFGSTTGKIQMVGNSLADAITTQTFIGCAFGSCSASFGVSHTFLQPIVQGALTKFDLTSISGFSIYGGDIEGTGIYLNIGATVNHLRSSGNEFSGFAGTYSAGTPVSAQLEDFFGNSAFSMRVVSGSSAAYTLTNLVLSFVKEAAALFRTTFQNSNAAAQQVDTEYKSAAGSTFVGQSAAGKGYMDARAAGGVALQVVGVDKVGVNTADELVIGTLTAAGANVGAGGAPPATVQGYIRVNIGGTTFKVPYYAN